MLADQQSTPHSLCLCCPPRLGHKLIMNPLQPPKVRLVRALLSRDQLFVPSFALLVALHLQREGRLEVKDASLEWVQLQTKGKRRRACLREFDLTKAESFGLCCALVKV